VEGALDEPKIERPACAAGRADEVRDPLANTRHDLGGMLDEPQRPAAERTRRRRGDDVDLGGRLDRQGPLGAPAGLQAREPLLVTHQLRLLSGAGATKAPGRRWPADHWRYESFSLEAIVAVTEQVLGATSCTP